MTVLGLAGVIPTAASAQRAVTPSTVFDEVTVIDVEQGKLLPDQRVVIAGNRIQAVGSTSAVQSPKGAQVVDARGKYLIPGLWDMHTHSVRSTDAFYPLFLANGVTGIRDAGSPVPLDTLRLWRQEILAGTRLGPPRQILSGHSLTNQGFEHCVRSEWDKVNNTQTCVADTADARHVVDSLKAAGADMIKPRALTPPMYFVIAAEARRLGIPFGGHANGSGFFGMQGPKTAVQASDSGARIVDHESGDVNKDCLKPTATLEACRSLAEHLQHNGTWMMLDRWYYVTGDNADFGLAQKAQTFWAGTVLPSGAWLRIPAGARPTDSVGMAQRAGLPILAGTDVSGEQPGALPGFVLHVELARLVVNGMTPLQALQAATLNPAKMWHATDSLGTVAAGKLADLVLLDANPLADITSTTAIRAVVANGRYFGRAALDSILRDVQAKTKQKP